MRYLDKIKRRKICRGKPILAQVSFPAWSCGRLVVVHPRMVVSLYNLISSIMEDHNNVTIKNMSVTSTSFLWYASRRKCVTFWFQLYESNIKSCHQLSNILRWCPASKEEMTNHSSSYFWIYWCVFAIEWDRTYKRETGSYITLLLQDRFYDSQSTLTLQRNDQWEPWTHGIAECMEKDDWYRQTEKSTQLVKNSKSSAVSVRL